MSEKMPSQSEREAPDDLFLKLEETLKRLRDAATPPPAPRESWVKKKFNPAASSSHQNEFNHALVEAVSQVSNVLRKTAESQKDHLEQMAEELSELRALSEDLDALKERSVRVEEKLRSAAANVRGLQERSAALETELAQAREQLSGEQGNLRRELGERIQQLLDEQRVCIRQLSLQASEEAVLADRARRATELKLEELARRVPPPPA